MNVILIGAALAALGITTASAGECSDQIGDVMLNVAKKSATFTVASAPAAQRRENVADLIERAKSADREGREDECLKIVKRIAEN